MKCQVPYNSEVFLTPWTPIGFCWSLLFGVSLFDYIQDGCVINPLKHIRFLSTIHYQEIFQDRVADETQVFPIA
jgi:hypothetical protein